MADVIWAVTSGEYSSYGVDSIFTTKQLAEEYANEFGGDIEEFPLNPKHVQVIRAGFKFFEGFMEESGKVSRIKAHSPRTTTGCRFDGNGGWFHCVAKDELHAAKIMNEKRIQLKASGLTLSEVVGYTEAERLAKENEGG